MLSMMVQERRGQGRILLLLLLAGAGRSPWWHAMVMMVQGRVRRRRPSAFALGVGGDLRRTDEWDFFFPFVCPSQWLLDGSGCRRCRRRSMDLRRTDEWDNFFPFVCPSPWLLDGT
jgi:hypothetical protein